MVGLLCGTFTVFSNCIISFLISAYNCGFFWFFTWIKKQEHNRVWFPFLKHPDVR